MKKILCTLLLGALGCVPPPPGSVADAKKAIDAANAQWPRLTSSGHADSIAEFYAANAVIMPPNMAPTRGKEAIRAFFATLVGKLGHSKMRGVHFEESDEISIEGESSKVILDGETFRAEIGQPIFLKLAHPLSFVRIAA